MAVPITVRRNDVLSLINASFPDYKGRKFRVLPRTGPLQMISYWEGGSRSYFVIIDMVRGRSMEVPQNGTMYDDPTIPSHKDVPPGYVVVEHRIFCGKDLGLRFHVHPKDMPALLGRGA